MDADEFDATPTYAVTSDATTSHLRFPEIRHLLMAPKTLLGILNVQLKAG